MSLRSGGVVFLATWTLVFAAACGSSGGSPTPDDRIPADAPFIDQRGLAFRPSSITARVAEPVYFKNSETAIHTVTINGKDESGMMKKNDLFIWTPSAAGAYKITCELHPQMKATVIVE
jgi:plastocyanin